MPRYYTQVGNKEIGFEVTQSEQGTIVRIVEPANAEAERHVDFAAVHASVETGEGLYSILSDGKSYQLYISRTAEGGFRAVIWRHRFDMRVLTEREWRLEKVAPKHTAATGQLVISSPMPGLVKAVLVAEGDQIESGQRMIVLEAMKMENDINSPREGRVTRVHVEAGQVVEGGKPLVTLE